MSVYDIAAKYKELIKDVEYPKTPKKPSKHTNEIQSEFGARMDQYESDIKVVS